MLTSSLLDGANRNLYLAARDRDRLLWIVNATRAWRDALLAGRDGIEELTTLSLRVGEVKRARLKDSQ